ncbi:hypothetical protein Tco_1409763 [Tanacetum coccineum]
MVDAVRVHCQKVPYTLQKKKKKIVTTPAVPATEDSPAVPEQTTVEIVMNMTPENRAHFESEKKAIHLILTRIGDEIYLTVDPVRQHKKCWRPSKGYRQGESNLLARNMDGRIDEQELSTLQLHAKIPGGSLMQTSGTDLSH